MPKCRVVVMLRQAAANITFVYPKNRSKMQTMSDLSDMQKRIIEFRDARDWKQFHNPKDLALSLVLEATEVLEHFQWKTPEEIEKYLKDKKSDVAEELVDTLYWVLLMSHDFEIDIVKVFEDKMAKNEAKYSVDKAKGSHKKYTELVDK